MFLEVKSPKMAASVPYNKMSTTSQSGTLFTKCCCCIPIRIGCFILGYLNLIINLIHTLCLVTLTASIAFSTHWFNHFAIDQPRAQTERVTEIKSLERPLLLHVEVLLLIALSMKIVWLVINVACLVGLHKKRPGPIKMYVTFATTRLILMAIGLVYLIIPGHTSPETIIIYSVDLGLAAYFIFVYYIYAMRLEREANENQETPELKPNDVVFMYPTNIDKQALVA
ncbi:unnamed protein product [Parnassius apollo]|uniref:(apollo) hypothetical protein n=1 Tax=Parnassius apollo TaxID=110799 RepID=A0A8S3XWH5_PARAO|nr:unnamed protein product [Parnassius apollo]